MECLNVLCVLYEELDIQTPHNLDTLCWQTNRDFNVWQRKRRGLGGWLRCPIFAFVWNRPRSCRGWVWHELQTLTEGIELQLQFESCTCNLQVHDSNSNWNECGRGCAESMLLPQRDRYSVTSDNSDASFKFECLPLHSMQGWTLYHGVPHAYWVVKAISIIHCYCQHH